MPAVMLGHDQSNDHDDTVPLRVRSRGRENGFRKSERYPGGVELQESMGLTGSSGCVSILDGVGIDRPL